ncbi:MAG: transposase [bacterium]
MPRGPNILFPGAHYHVISRGNNRAEIFVDDSDRKKYIETLKTAIKTFELRIFAYSLMSNHVHLYLETEQANLSDAMFWINKTYSVYFNRRHGRTGHLFEARFKRKLVQSERYFLALIRYIHLNPVKAGIVARPEDYAWGSYREIAELREGALSDWKSVLEHFGGGYQKARKSFLEFMSLAVPKKEWSILNKVRNGILGDIEYRRKFG